MQNATKKAWGINLACWHVQRSQGFNRDWNEEVLTANVGILFLLAGSGKLCCSSCLAGGPSDVGFIQGAGDSYVPAQWPAALPWDECQTIRSLPVCAEQPRWLFCHGSSGWGIIIIFYYLWLLRAVTFSVINSRTLRAFQEAVRKKQSCFVNWQHIEIHIASQIAGQTMLVHSAEVVGKSYNDSSCLWVVECWWWMICYVRSRRVLWEQYHCISRFAVILLFAVSTNGFSFHLL